MGFDALGRIEGIRAPTLILHGTEDAVVDSRNTALLALRIPDASVELFPGCGPPLLLGAARPLRRRRRGVPPVSCSRSAAGSATARARRRRASRSTAAARRRRTRELDERSERLAAGLLEAGLAPGDRVATLTGTSTEHVVVFFACAKAGLILMPLNTRLAPPELAYQLADAEPAVLLCSDEYAETAAALHPRTAGLEELVC